MNVVFDLDGTLIDSRPRLFRLFQELVPESTLSFDEYWAYKTSGFSNERILEVRFERGPEAVRAFVREWMLLIEAPRFLALDRVQAGVPAMLAALSGRADLYVCTARHNGEAARGQLEEYGILSSFVEVLVTEQRVTKEALIAQHVTGRGGDDWMVGDTGKDIMIGKSLGMRTCAVLNGFMSESQLVAYEPDVVLMSAADFAPERC